LGSGRYISVGCSCRHICIQVVLTQSSSCRRQFVGWVERSDTHRCGRTGRDHSINWDNAPTESWFNSFKNERVHGWRFATREDMTATAFEYIEVFYNRKRLHSTLGYKSPTLFLQDWLTAQQMEKRVA